jgi:hypothetical protein
VARGLRPANGTLRRLWTLQHLRMQWSRFTWIMLVIWYIIIAFYILFHLLTICICILFVMLWIDLQNWLSNLCLQELIAKSIESSDLNFSRYGDTFFEASFLNQQKIGFVSWFISVLWVSFWECLILDMIVGELDAYFMLLRHTCFDCIYIYEY